MKPTPKPSPFPRDMLPRELDYLRKLSAEVQVAAYEEILILYSGYMAADGQAKEQLNNDILAVINMPPESQNE